MAGIQGKERSGGFVSTQFDDEERARSGVFVVKESIEGVKMLRITANVLVCFTLSMGPSFGGGASMSGSLSVGAPGADSVAEKYFPSSSRFVGLVEPSAFVKHWWNVPCTITDRRGQGGTFNNTFRVCAEYSATARIKANNECEKQYRQKYGLNCCTCKGKPEDTGGSCNN